MIIAKIGERTYEFESIDELSKARSIYTKSFETQNDFETELEIHGIEVRYDI